MKIKISSPSHEGQTSVNDAVGKLLEIDDSGNGRILIDDPQQARNFLTIKGSPDETAVRVEIDLTPSDKDYVLSQQLFALDGEKIGDLKIYNPERQEAKPLNLRSLQFQVLTAD